MGFPNVEKCDSLLGFFTGDGNVSFEEFVEIVSNIGGASEAAPTDQDQEEQELRDAFRVSLIFNLFQLHFFNFYSQLALIQVLMHSI